MDPKMFEIFDQDERRHDAPQTLLKQDSMTHMREWESNSRFDTGIDGIFTTDQELQLFRGTSQATNPLTQANNYFTAPTRQDSEKRYNINSHISLKKPNNGKPLIYKQ